MSTDAVVIWGELLWDRFPAALGGDRLGGAPANVAWHLAQAGGWAQLVTRVGDDADGRRALAELDGLVDTSLIQVDPARATGEVTVEFEQSETGGGDPDGAAGGAGGRAPRGIDGGEPRYTLHAGRAWEHIACTDAVAAAIRDAGVFVYGTLAQRTAEGLAEWRRAIAAADRALKVYDANLRPNDRASHAVGEAVAHADVIKLNDREVGQLRRLLGWEDPIAELRARRPRVVIVTHGAAGSTIYPSSGGPAGTPARAPAGAPAGTPIEVPGAPASPGGDNVGCGDAYLALLVFGMTSGWDLATSGRVASRWAAAVAGARGATPRFDEDRITELLETA